MLILFSMSLCYLHEFINGTLYSVDPGTGGPRTRGPKLACTMHVRMVASSLGK